jgi:AcrR family transcriptional regulator
MNAVLARPRLTRDTVIDAAADIASRDGIDALSMRSLADELDVSTMAAYRHIPSKRALIEALLLRALDVATEMATVNYEDASGAFRAQVAVEAGWRALEAYPGLRFELRHPGEAREAWADWLNYTLVGLLVGMSTEEQASSAARAVAA